MQWIYLSPHLDDVALSCGGLLWLQSQAGHQVSVWTICAGDPPDAAISAFALELHARWETGLQAVNQRRTEDIHACQILGADYRHFNLPDCIYRRDESQQINLYPHEESLFGPLHPDEATLVERLASELACSCSEQAQLVCPLTLGNHVDHELTRRAAESLGRPLWVYADYPYALDAQAELARLGQEGWEQALYPISSQAMLAWEQSIAAHASQISTFWQSEDEMRLALRAYCARAGGIPLWKRNR